MSTNKLFTAVIGIFILSAMAFTNPNSGSNPVTSSIYDIKISSIENSAIDLSTFKGKKILFVNVASKCGYTPQYEDLQKLHETYKDQLVIIGVPCNQFLGQEPGTHEEIVEFCQKNYGVTFLLTEKVDVKGDDQHPLYAWLTSKELNGVMDSKVKWNFQKYLVSESGELLEMYASGVKPFDDEIISKL